MDLELILWILFFVGGYSVVLGYLLRIAIFGGGGGAGTETGAGGPDSGPGAG